MVDGLITAPAPKVATVDSKPELAPTLRLRTAATVVQVARPNGATRKPVQVRIAGINISFVFQCLVLYVEMTRDLVSSLRHL